MRQIIAVPTLRRSIVLALSEIANNRTLSRNGYDLSEELSKAVDLVARAKAALPDVFTEGMPVSPFGRQQGLFDDEFGDSRVTDATTLLLADILNSGKPSDLRKILATYNNEAAQASGGQMDMFSGSIPTKEEIHTNVNEHFRNATPKEQQALVDAAIAERKRRAETDAEQRERNETSKQTPHTTESDSGQSGLQGKSSEGVREAHESGELRSDDRGRNAGSIEERESNIHKNQELNYLLSDEVDENGRQFVLNSNGKIEFGEIDSRSGLAPAPILLSEGIITNPATNDGYGLVHIEARHGDQIRKAGYSSVVSFIEDVAQNWQSIKEGKDRAGNKTYLLQLTDKHNNTLVVELSGDGTYWNINTAGIFKTSYGKNRKVMYSRHTTDKQPTEAVEESQDVEQSGTQTSSSMNSSASPIVSSADKDTTKSPITNDLGENIAKKEEKVDVNPTEAQKAAGNYKMEHRRVDGYNISIENPKGSVRSGVDANGNKWETTMQNDYGYIRGTEGVDGDHIDVFLSDTPEEGDVFVVDQVNEDGSFDEHKVMYGFPTEQAARDAYLSNYEPGWTGLGAITHVSKDEFKKWIQSSRRKTKPFAEYKSVKPIRYDSQGNPIDENGNLIIEDVKSIDDISDLDFINPVRTIGLPALPQNVNEAIGANDRKIIIKKNIFVKNRDTHAELSPIDSRDILHRALYNPNLIGTIQPIRRPDYKVAIQTGDKNTVVVLDIYAGKDNVEIVGWRKVDTKGLEKMKRQAEREGGQFLILSPSEGSAAALSALPSDVSSDMSKLSPSSERHLIEAPSETEGPDLVPTPDNVISSDRKVNTSSADKQTESAESSLQSKASETVTEPYTITATTYTDKKGKTSDVHLVKFNRELTAEEKAALCPHPQPRGATISAFISPH